MRYFFKYIYTIMVGLLASTLSLAAPKFISNTYNDAKLMIKQHVQHPFYIGLGLGVGSTDWSEMLADPGDFAAESAPVSAKSSSLVITAYMGYQFSEHFVVESIYTRYPRTTVGFEDGNTYGLSSLKTDTDTYSLLGKFLVPFGFSHVNVYADAGITVVHRHDVSYSVYPAETPDYKMKRGFRPGASFGFGVATNLSTHLFSEASFQYTTGFARASVRPAQDYIPFVYSLTLNMGYRF